MPSFLRIRSLILLVFLACGTPVALCQPQSDTDCGHSTVEDAWGRDFASRAKAFLAELQAVVEKDDSARFASLVRYPVRVFDGSSRAKVSTAAELIKRYPSFMSPAVRKAILDQSPACLFGNYQGVMIGDGQIWFTEQPNQKMRIITINADAPK